MSFKKIEVMITRSQSDYIDVSVDGNLSEGNQYQEALRKATKNQEIHSEDFSCSGDVYCHIERSDISKFQQLKPQRFNNVKKNLELLFEDDNLTKEEQVEFLNQMKSDILS